MKTKEVISKACNQKTDSEEDYFRHEKIFMENIVGFIEKSKSCKEKRNKSPASIISVD